MRLTYDNIEISLGPPGIAGSRTHGVSFTPMYDDTGLDYRHTRAVFDCVGVINPASTSYTRLAGNNVMPSTGIAPALTHAAIRDRLSQIGRTLIYSDNLGNVLLRSPAINPNVLGAEAPSAFACDVTGGPIVLRAPEILQVLSDKTIVVRVVYQTDINESFLAVAKPSVLLSNRWSVEESLDDCAFSTLTYDGVAIFRADVLNSRQVNGRTMVPDDLRDYFAAFNIQPGYKRMQVWVRDAGDLSCRYRIVDAQKAVTLIDFDAMDVECMQTDGVAQLSWEDSYMKHEDAAFEHLANIFGDASSVDIFLKPGKIVGELLRSVRDTKKIALGMLPRASMKLTVIAKGNPSSSRRKLAELCYKVLVAVIGTIDRVTSSTAAMLTQDKMGKWVKLSVDIDRGPVSTLILANTLGGVAASIAGLSGLVPADDGIALITTQTPNSWPPFPGDNGVRGAVSGPPAVPPTPMQALLTQVLSTPYVAPAPPPAPLPATGAAGQNLLP